jgi:5-methylthioribose kinase
MTKDPKLCEAYDQIADRQCRYYADHGGKHNFARSTDRDSSLERELRRQLDEMTKARDEVCAIAEDILVADPYLKQDEIAARLAELKKVGTP